ncbi:MAG: carboxypeptidase-like regulatory domain-containing protein [Candidatus Bathyarchaeia archaeon]
MNKKIGAVTLLVLMSLAVALTPIAIVFGQSLGVGIIQVAPIAPAGSSTIVTGQSQYNGTVGQAFNLKGTIYTTNGSYQVILDQNVIASGISDGYYVNANFTVPAFPSGSYDLILRDVAANINSTGTTPESFQVLTGYHISAVPSKTQEGSSIALSVTVNGGVPNTVYVANVSVVLPSPLNTEYSEIVPMGTSNQDGIATAQVTYPDSSFQPNGNTTDYVGTYNVYFNQSIPLAQNQFSIGFLDSTTYHRGDTVTIGATGYTPNQAATLSITNDATGATLGSPEPETASADGVINATWVVPSNAVIGKYNVTITPTGTQKAIQDVETFSVPGYSIQVKTVNLASAVVPQIKVQALDQASGTVYNGTSGSDGIVDLKLETGICSLTAFWNGVNVGETTITVTGNGTFTMICQLTDLKILVQNENGITLPFVNLAITYQYQQSNGTTQTGNVSGQTDPSGTYTLNSTLTGISYTINASLYNQVFNSGNNTVNNLPAQALSEVVIICPNEALTINVVGYNKAAIPGASINLVELTSGLFYTATTDSSGSATSQVTFGMYRLQIYKDSILINETNIDAFNDSQQQIVCTLYGIQVSVSVVDFFGTPISNANVTLNGPATEQLSAITPGDGTATFNNVIGGDMQIVAFAQGAQNSYQAVTLTVDKPTSVKIQMDGYIVLGSLLIPVSSFIAIVIILVAIILLAIVEVYRRKKS